MPEPGLGGVIVALILCGLASGSLGILYLRVTGAEASRRQRVRQAVQRQRQSQQRPPLLSEGEVPANPADLLRSQNPWWRRLLRR